MSDLNTDALLKAIQNPEDALIALEKYEAEQRLINFMDLMWTVLEPGRPFVRSWPLEAVCECLEAVTAGDFQGRNLLMTVPPGFTKSLSTNVTWPAWEWGPKNMPWLRYVSASYSERLTIRDNRRCRILLGSELYQLCWGHRFGLLHDQNEKVKFENDHRGFKMATSVGGYVMGERGDRFIIDDPNNTKSTESEPTRESVLQWFSEVVPSRINDPEKSTIIVIMQRVHERDVAGHILEHDLNYEHLNIPMEYDEERHCKIHIGNFFWQDPRKEPNELACPERFSRVYLENELKPSLRSWGGEYAVAGQLQQSPVPRGGGMFQKDDIQIMEQMPPNVRIVKTLRGWDLAGTKKKKSPWTAGVKMAKLSDGRLVILNVKREQRTPGGVEDMINEMAEIDGKRTVIDIPQDPGQAGLSQKRALAARLHGYNVKFSPESGDKETRARPLAAQAEAGNLWLLKGSWNDTFIEELCTFPYGQFADQVDAASRAYSGLLKNHGDVEGLAPPETIKSETANSR